MMTLTEIQANIEQAKIYKHHSLHLFGDGTYEFPYGLTELTHLENLYLHGFNLREFPQTITNLKKLKTLLFIDCQLSHLPEYIVKLTNLAIIDCSNNSISELPKDFHKLNNLRGIDFSHNNLSKIPLEFSNLKKLRSLKLTGNRIREFPIALEKLFLLESIGIDIDLLDEFANSIHKNTIKALDLSEQSLMDDIPESIGRLKSLIHVNLESNALQTIPQSLFQVTNLQHLYLGYNLIKEIPNRISDFKNLRKLVLAANEIKMLPISFGKLTNLNSLNLSANDIISLPKSITKLVKLQHLDLTNNKIEKLPIDIGNLNKLTSLLLDGSNPIKKLPPSLCKAKHLSEIGLPSTLIDPPKSVQDQGLESIIAYLEELDKAKFNRYESKLILLGDGGEGKTCVSRALRNLDFQSQNSTRGVEVEPWKFVHPDYPKSKEHKITLNIWDFEGQEIHHQTHQFFLTEESIYILVFKCREIFRMDRAEYWLDTIRARAPKSKVFLVITQCEERVPVIPLDELKQNYGDLFQDKNWFFFVGCSDSTGIKNLRKNIQKAASILPLMGVDWPASFSNIESDIEKIAAEKKENETHIKRTQLNKIFSSRGLKKHSYNSLSNLLSKLGIITHFPFRAELKDFVVIKPQWLTKAISLALEHPSLQFNNGEISHKDLSDIWSENYPGMFTFFHNCMKEFELCYDLESGSKSLIPLRFKHLKPSIPWSIKGYKERRVKYTLNIRPPMGLMSRFIVKTNHMIVKTTEYKNGVFWHTGVFLETGTDNFKSQALCEFNPEDKTLSITVRAAYPQNFLEQLHYVVMAVLEFYEGIQPQRFYGCIYIIDDKELPCAGEFSEEKILYAMTKSNVLNCENSWHDIDPKTLLYGFPSAGESISKKEIRDIVHEEIERGSIWAKKEFNELLFQIEQLDNKNSKMNAALKQKIDLSLRTHINHIGKLLDNRVTNSAPAIISIVPLKRHNWNLNSLYKRKFSLVPYCEHEGGIHPIINAVEPFYLPKDWITRIGPNIGYIMNLLVAGLTLGYAALPLTVDPKVLSKIKDQANFMKELASILNTQVHFTSSLSPVSKHGKSVLTKGVAGYNFIQNNTIYAKHALSSFLETIAPANFHHKEWGDLRRIQMNDNSFRWLCSEHAKNYQ